MAQLPGTFDRDRSSGRRLELNALAEALSQGSSFQRFCKEFRWLKLKCP